MKFKTTLEYLGFVLSIWAAIGILSVFIVGESTDKVIAHNNSSAPIGWMRLGDVGDTKNYYFEKVSGTSPFIEKGTILVLKDGKKVNMRDSYFSTLWWLPLIGEPNIIKTLKNKECVKVHDVRTVAMSWVYILVSEQDCET